MPELVDTVSTKRARGVHDEAQEGTSTLAQVGDRTDEKKPETKTGLKAKAQPKNFKRKQSDYFVMIGICFVCYHLGEWIKPGRSTPAECEALKEAFNPLEIDMENQYTWWFVSGWMMMGVAIAVLVGFFYGCICVYDPSACEPVHFWKQIQTAWINICIMLPGCQQAIQVLQYKGCEQNVSFSSNKSSNMDLF